LNGNRTLIKSVRFRGGPTPATRLADDVREVRKERRVVDQHLGHAADAHQQRREAGKLGLAPVGRLDLGGLCPIDLGQN